MYIALFLELVKYAFVSCPLICLSRGCPAGEIEIPLCNYDEITCRDGSCIDARLRCNGYKDCSDGEDELGCPQRGIVLNWFNVTPADPICPPERC
jgi:hypothetical protein